MNNNTKYKIIDIYDSFRNRNIENPYFAKHVSIPFLKNQYKAI
jgi:hypothetical protein